MTHEAQNDRNPAPLPMDPRIRDIQPGGGMVFRLEKAWGMWRRWWLGRFRKDYVRRMHACRQGDPAGVPHEVLDPRDLKLHRNQTDCHWRPDDDPFAWRDRLPFARAGLAELVVFSLLFWTPAIGLATAAWMVSGLSMRLMLAGLAAGFSLLGLVVAWFFRDPHRVMPTGPGEVVSPADGKVVAIQEIENEYLGGRAVEISIFLSLLNVHVNRTPVASRVMSIGYQPGKYLNAMRPASARENEQLLIQLEEAEPPYRRLIVRPITGALARRIVCWVKPGDVLRRGEPFGMIKLGSRTVLALPQEDRLSVLVQVGDKVKAGSSVLARYEA